MKALAAFALALSWGASAHAGWSVSADVEHFRWGESTDPAVNERGPRWGLGWEYRAERPAGWQFAYQGQFRRGTVDYTGSFLFTNLPTTARVRYTGLVNEAQGIYRFGGDPLGLEFVSGLGWDLWERNILPNQREDYSVLFLRLGANVDPRLAQGWFGGGGLKLPFYTSENAHFDEIGGDSNPRLKPEGRWSPYAQAGYRFSPAWSLIAYYDSYRFAESKAVPVNLGTSSVFFFQPQSTLQTYGLRLRYSFP